MDKLNVYKTSFIIPVYNCGRIHLTGWGNLHQLPNWCEIIYIDDGSTDDTTDIIRKLADEDERVVFIRQEHKGAGAARNAGIRAARGEYIAFLDVDDCYPSVDVLQRLYEKAKANDALICGGSFCEVHDGVDVTEFHGDYAGFTFDKEGWVNYKDYQFDYGFYRFIYKREFLLSNNLFFPDYLRYQDPPFMMKAFNTAGKFYTIPDVTYRYNVKKANDIWTVEKVLDLISAINENLEYSRDNELYVAYNFNYSRLCRDFSNVIIQTALNKDKEGQILEKLLDMRHSIRRDILSSDNPALEYIGNRLLGVISSTCVRLKEEGWYINKKLFRFYTYPLRMIGNYIKRRKNAK